MKTIIRKLAIGLGASLLIASHACSEPLQILTLPYPPYQYEENGQLKGFVAAIVKEVFKRMDQPITITVYPFVRALKMIEDGEADAIFTFAKNPEREVFSDFPAEVLVDQKMSLFVPNNSPISFDGGLSKLRQYQIGVVIGYRYGPVFDEAVKNGILPNIQETNSPESNAKKLEAGRIDLWMSNREQPLFTIKKLGFSEAIKELKPEVQLIPSYIAFSKKRNLGNISERFSNKLREMKSDGTYKRLIAEYWK
jgi:polar amino acid transport system substrate-binding protein